MVCVLGIGCARAIIPPELHTHTPAHPNNSQYVCDSYIYIYMCVCGGQLKSFKRDNTSTYAHLCFIGMCVRIKEFGCACTCAQQNDPAHPTYVDSCVKCVYVCVCVVLVKNVCIFK